MKRITMVLQEPDAAGIRKAVSAAQGAAIVETPLPSRLTGVDMFDIQCEKIAAELNKPVRGDVIARDDISGSIISAMQNLARAGQAVFIITRRKLSGLVA